MRLIEAADAELFEAMSLADRMGRAARMLERLEEQYYKNPDDPDAALRYALGLLATLPTAGSEIETWGRIGGVTEALDQVVAAVPDHWLARYLRARLRCLALAGKDPSEDELGGVAAAVDELIELQSRTGGQPYFVAAFVLASRLAEWPGRSRDPDRVARLRAEVRRGGGRPMPFRSLATVLNDPFAAGYAPVAAPERHGSPTVRPSAAGLEGRTLLRETAAGLSRLIDYLRAHRGSFSGPSGPGMYPEADRDTGLDGVLGAAREVRGGLRGWAAGDAGAEAATRPALPGLRYALEDFLTYCETAGMSIAGRPDLVSGDAGWLHRELKAVQTDVERLIDLLRRCQGLATRPL
ncbi:hypothetical protein ACOT81_13060 [Streptomyces sp. WI04-05B]|uniref:hypothetical protein n=1 Tax=Streptomyces TaxID=1883 RepID=UPI0029A2D2E1|nr:MULTISPECIES: hypothetical protein [unclassified Streptomyces]MDX2545370.1 hypothetical protein [Streptomyces sp. WI04-05B]MDX2588135.1 hypothetical protein [Streptomyces sp. WI04-05A]